SAERHLHAGRRHHHGRGRADRRHRRRRRAGRQLRRRVRTRGARKDCRPHEIVAGIPAGISPIVASAGEETSMKIGVAGLGKMGAAMAKRLKEVGHDVFVWNRSADKAKPLADAGATVAKTPGELASKSEIVISMLTDAAAIDAVYHGADG